MSKLRKRLSKWFLDRAKKLDEDTVYENTFVSPAPCLIPSSQPIIMYDTYNVNRLHAQHQISKVTLDSYKQCVGVNVGDVICRKLSDAIADEIYKNYMGDVKKTQVVDDDFYPSTIYSLDVYVCKPTRKESL